MLYKQVENRTPYIIGTVLFILLNINNSYGQNNWQKGFILNNNSDTIYGLIDKRNSKSNSEACYFKEGEESEIQVLTPTNIIAYRFIDSKYYVSRNIEGVNFENPVFLEYLINGRASLFFYRDNNDRFFIEKDSAIYELKNTEAVQKLNDMDYSVNKNEYMGILSLLFEDAQIQDKIKDCKLSTYPLIKIAKDYHEKVCFDKECIIYEKSKVPFKVEISLLSGISFNSINFGNLIKSNYEIENRFGLRFDFNEIVGQENLNLALDLNLFKYSKYYLNTVRPGDGILLKYNDTQYYLNMDKEYGYGRFGVKSLEADLKTFILEIPVSLNYTFSKGKIRPYAGLGFTNMIILSKNKDLLVYTINFEFKQIIPAYLYGGIIKFGTKFEINNKHKLFTEVNYNYSQSIKTTDAINFSSNSFSFIAGYTF